MGKELEQFKSKWPNGDGQVKLTSGQNDLQNGIQDQENGKEAR